MTIIVNLDVMMAKRKIRSKTLAQALGITEANLSILKTGKAKAIRFSTLAAICEVLDCQPGDLLEFKHEWNLYSCIIKPKQSSPTWQVDF